MAVLLARGQITIVAIKDGKDGAQGKDYWQQDVWVDLSAAEYDRNVWYPVVGGALPSGGFVGIKVSVGLNSGTKPSWSTHSAGFSVDFHIDTQRSGWGETPGETIIYTDNYAWCPVSPVSYRQLSNDSRPVLYLRGGGKYRVIATIAIEWKIYKDGYTWQSGQYSQSAMPQNSRPTPEGHTLKGDKGDKGNPGKDSITWTLTPDTITYDTDDSGKAINVGTGKTTTLRVLRGNDELTNFTIKGVKNMVNCLASRLNNTNSFYISTITAQKVTLGTDTINVSCTNGSFDVEFDIDGITYTATAKFAVNVAAFTGIVAFDNKSYKSQFEKVSNRLNSTATKDELAQAKSEIEQTAREISLSVSEKSIARRNLLVGSDFRKQTNDFIISNDARIEMNSGYQGTNCIKVIDDTDGKPHYLGVYWDGSQGGKSIKIEKGKKYTISCWYFTNNTNASFCLEAIYTDKQTNGKRLGQVTYEASNCFSPKSDQWQLFTTVINTKDAKSDYIAFNFWEFCNINAGRIVAYISRPMVEAGAEYNGWTLSDKDYDYVGANLIDNSRTFELGGNVIRVVGTKKLVGDAYELSATLGDDYNTFYEIDNTAFKLNTDYTISFEVKGDAKYMGVFVYYKPTNTPWAYCKEQQDNPLYEANGDGKTDGYGVLLEVKDLSDKQQKVWSHFKFKERLPESIYLQFLKNSEQTGVTSWSVTITKPKIEVGAVVTEYTECKSDLVDKASLKKAGIEVKSDEVLLYGNRIRVDNNGQTAAMFIGGKINADFIDADKIEVKHLWAKSEDGTTKVGYFGNYEIDACKVNDTYAPLFVGADTADKALFYVSKDGYMNAKAGKIGSFLISPTGYANSIIAGTWKDATNIDINKFGTRLELSDTKLEFLYGSGSAIGGDVVYSSTNAQIAIDPSKARNGFTSCGLDIRVDVFAATACGIHLDVSGFLGDPAIYIKNGTVWGFRPHIVSVGSDYHLRDDDTIVMCTNWNNDITLTLPDDPQHGQYYVVIHRGRNIIFKSNADQIKTKNNPSGVSSFGDSTFYQINWIFYDGEQWILIYKT